MGKVLHGDCLNLLRGLPDNSIDAIATDPPYALEFMGKGWDKVLPHPDTWVEALRVAKPGAHLAAFGGTRTYHRLTCAIEDAGWEIRQCIMWCYGQGFPKSLNIGKALQRPELEGWGTDLKPAYEPIVLARKPVKGAIARNFAEWGTGGLSIEGCRVDGKRFPPNFVLSHHALCECLGEKRVKSESGGTVRGVRKQGVCFSAETLGVRNHEMYKDESGHETVPRYSCLQVCPACDRGWNGEKLSECKRCHTPGVWACPVAALDEQTKDQRCSRPAGPSTKGAKRGGLYELGFASHDSHFGRRCDIGDGGNGANASRFFPTFHEPFLYNSKASKRDRTQNGTVDNTHPTVKPTSMLRWLTRLITPPGGVVLDCFGGSGSTAIACLEEGFDYVLMEREAEYIDIINARIAAWHEQRPPESGLKQLGLLEV